MMPLRFNDVRQTGYTTIRVEKLKTLYSMDTVCKGTCVNDFVATIDGAESSRPPVRGQTCKKRNAFFASCLALFSKRKIQPNLFVNSSEIRL